MPKSEADSIEELKDHIYAVQQLLLAHVIAVDKIDRGATLHTIDILRRQRDSFVEAGRGRVAVRLNAFIDVIDESLN